MPVQRHFLGWDAPLTQSVRAWLLPEPLTGPADLRADLLIVPTRQAGRRLREALARACAAQHTALLAGRIATPASFLEALTPTGGAASGALVAAAWAAVLQRLPLRAWRALFPAPPQQTLDWALQLGARLQQLRHALAEGGWRMADVPAAAGAALEEPERWQALARLEAAYLKILRHERREDPCERALRLASAPALPPEIRRIVVAGVPDPSGLAVRAWERLAEQYPVHLLIHAPADCAAAFDRWGRPLPETWCRQPLLIPEPERNLRVAATPAGQAALALDLLREEAVERYGADAGAEQLRKLAANLALGVPDAALLPFLETALTQAGLTVFDPADIPLPDTALAQALTALCRLHSENTYAAFSEAVRQADVLDFVRRRTGVEAAELLEDLDDFQARHLSPTWQALVQRITARASAAAEKKEPDRSRVRHAALTKALPALQELLQPLQQPDLPAGVRTMLLTLYAGYELPAEAAAARRFADAAAAVDAVLHEAAEVPEELCSDRLAILQQGLASAALERAPAAEAVELEGWLELPWNDAPLMILTGVNEGRLPESRLGDLFLPDSLRHSLGLRDNEARYARDSYLLASLLATRAAQGRLVLITGRTSAEGDPLKPSRLLFRCPDPELGARVRRLLTELPTAPRGGAPQASFKLNPCPAGGFDPRAAGAPDPADFLQQPFSVTAFRDYLACPFRFYLKRLLTMAALDDQATHLDALGFGTLLHTALQSVLSRPEWCDGDREAELADELCAAATAYARRQWGPLVPPMVALQVDVARQRLRAAARVQAEQARAGWVIQACEQKVDFTLDGVPIRGKIDRLDRHRDGRWRIVDYKTSDQGSKPDASHLARARTDTPPYAQVSIDGKSQRWTDLQLPLYLQALPPGERAAVELAYFNLPKAVEHTRIEVWAGFAAADLGTAAEACARGVLADIRAGRFWPPTDTSAADDFEPLFTAEPEECFDAELIRGKKATGELAR